MIRRVAGHARPYWRALWFAWELLRAAAVAPSGSPEERALWLHQLCRRLVRVLGLRVVARGPVPRGLLVACNHLGYVDIVVLASLTPVVFVAKQEIARWTCFGWFARKAGSLFVDRRRRSDVARVADAMREPLECGLTVLLFPEATSTDGRGVLPFKSSLLEPAIRSRCAVAPAAIAYCAPLPHDAAKEVCWWGSMTLPPHLWNLLKLPWIEARVAWGNALAHASDRKGLATELYVKSRALHATIDPRTAHDFAENA